MYMRRILFALFASLALVSTARAYNLSADWSDTQNPNGPWSYRVGTTVLPSWPASLMFSNGQPAYQPANSVGAFLPSWFKLISTPVGFDALPGDVVVHTNDNYNGNEGLGPANVLFTAPSTAYYNIFGGLWNASTAVAPSDYRPRPQDWQLLVNGSQVAFGTLSAIPGEFSRANQQTFSFSDVLLAEGDAVQLNIYRNAAAQAGYFVGADLTIQAVPEPSTWMMLLMGSVFLMTRIKKQRCSLLG